MPLPVRVLRLWCLGLLCLCGIVPAGAAPARATDYGCGDVAVVFARGSGQRLGQRESTAFLTAFSARLGSDVRAVAYELGTATYGGARYPAVGVGVDSSDAFENLLDAGSFWTGNEGGRYRASVAAGATELRAYVTGRLAACPDERVVLSGYSQGAQVVGDALAPLARAVRDRIAYVGLFGDPKLSLPEGRGIFPAACRGHSLSPWRRGNVGCYTDNGVLDARSSYVPPDLAERVGSWCDRDDPVCNSNLADFLHSSHGAYAQPGKAVDQAARESALAVRAALGKRGQKIDVATDGSVALTIGEYWASPGTSVRFDASASALVPEAVAAYQWDFDGDGATDRTTTTPVADHVYPATFTGRVLLRVAAEDGAELLTSAAVHVDRAGLGPRMPSAPAAVTVRAAHGDRGALVGWRAPAQPRATAWRIHDADGRLLAHVPADVRQVDLPALPDRTTTLTVEAVNEYGSSTPARATPRGAGSSRFGRAVPAADVDGAGGGRAPDAETGRAGKAGPAAGGAADPPPAAALGRTPELTTGLVAVAVALLLTTTGALWFWLLRSQFTVCGPTGRHRRRRQKDVDRSEHSLRLRRN
ncbi:cutinase family protein [Cryptosporangium sp. NPDC051539]|uniref:cutinase family protein n=1 Tax=Cryptosporangium sp. NPDC051539 TaxID=3363962 RepID=UPI00378F1619